VPGTPPVALSIVRALCEVPTALTSLKEVTGPIPLPRTLEGRMTSTISGRVESATSLRTQPPNVESLVHNFDERGFR
jgi:hypothetical protein